MLINSRRIAPLLTSILTLSAVTAHAQTFDAIPLPEGTTPYQNYTALRCALVSGNGNTVAFEYLDFSASRAREAVWYPGTGTISLLDGRVSAISDDGRRIFGYTSSRLNTGRPGLPLFNGPVFWELSTSPTPIWLYAPHFAPGTSQGSPGFGGPPTASSPDGRTVAGLNYTAVSTPGAYPQGAAWLKNDFRLSFFNRSVFVTDPVVRPVAVTSNGFLGVGVFWARSNGESDPFPPTPYQLSIPGPGSGTRFRVMRWDTTGWYNIPNVTGYGDTWEPEGSAAATPDCNTVFGTAVSATHPNYPIALFRYTAGSRTTGTQLISFVAGMVTSVDAAGSVVTQVAAGNPAGYIWTKSFGIYNLRQYAVEVLGLGTQLQGYGELVPFNVSRDGTTIVGEVRNPSGTTQPFRLRDPNKFQTPPALPSIAVTLTPSRSFGGGGTVSPSVLINIANIGGGTLHNLRIESVTVDGMEFVNDNVLAFPNGNGDGRFIYEIKAGTNTTRRVSSPLLPTWDTSVIRLVRITLRHERGTTVITRRMRW